MFWYINVCPELVRLVYGYSEFPFCNQDMGHVIFPRVSACGGKYQLVSRPPGELLRRMCFPMKEAHPFQPAPSGIFDATPRSSDACAPEDVGVLPIAAPKGRYTDRFGSL